MNVLAAWQRGYTGRNVVVTILDDGIERNHPDLLQNYVSGAPAGGLGVRFGTVSGPKRSLRLCSKGLEEEGFEMLRVFLGRKIRDWGNSSRAGAAVPCQ